jgi:hypothetical protein
LSTLTPFSYTSSKRKERKRTNSNNSLSKQTHQTSPAKKIKSSEKKIKDRFLSMKNIIKDTDNVEDNDLYDDFEDDEFDYDNDNIDDESQIEKNNKNDTEDDDADEENDEDDDDSDDEFDDAGKWQDFDIETLNFDKFIKDHQTSSNKDGNNQKDSYGNNKKKDLNQMQTSKRKLDKDVVDPMELKAKRRRNRVLPIEIQGLMGEANLAYARGDTNRAIDVCVDVIRYAPKASEPYQLLSLLYSEMGQNDKALRVGLIAAQLNKDPDEWIQLISQALIEGDPDLVLFCYNKYLDFFFQFVF